MCSAQRLLHSLDPALVTLAHEGAAAYREEFDLLYRREATHANAMWQADHTPLDVWLLDEAGKPAKPYLTAIEDDYSRMIVDEANRLKDAGLELMRDFADRGEFGLVLLGVEHVLVANQTQVVTKDVVETAQQNLIIGPG